LYRSPRCGDCVDLALTFPESVDESFAFVRGRCAHCGGELLDECGECGQLRCDVGGSDAQRALQGAGLRAEGGGIERGERLIEILGVGETLAEHGNRCGLLATLDEHVRTDCTGHDDDQNSDNQQPSQPTGASLGFGHRVQAPEASVASARNWVVA